MSELNHSEVDSRGNKQAVCFAKINEDSQLSGRIRVNAKDFQVDEIQQFTPSGIGEHVWLHIQKTGENTDWVAKILAQIAGVNRRDVSYAGMKDRHAVTTQWFSVQMPGREAPNWTEALAELDATSIKVIAEFRHDRKLKRGALKGNEFKLTLREFSGSEKELHKAVNTIKEQGVPNYYGVQRFGHNGFNITKAQQWFSGQYRVKDRNKRSIYLSAARSWIFNHILSARVVDGSWNQSLEGDVYMLKGSKSCFTENVSDDIKQRIINHDLSPTAALWGRGRLASQQKVGELETSISKQFEVLSTGLETHGLKQERRALRLSVKDLEYQWIDEQVVCLRFTLPAGAYATTVLQEIGEFI